VTCIATKTVCCTVCCQEDVAMYDLNYTRKKNEHGWWELKSATGPLTLLTLHTSPLSVPKTNEECKERACIQSEVQSTNHCLSISVLSLLLGESDIVHLSDFPYCVAPSPCTSIGFLYLKVRDFIFKLQFIL
jgi:hypothetical protein